ncbi:MAG TPA: aminotransferase class I/II-fold pyridoxal phosphate-dependent enzyme [Phycisphaerae bacterium]|nr:aminotransferase class I/II-fold pyridoxal phosphate-dependent enzyme [Phycisphaerae bacterium]HOI53624.1 aminotransferase class I/II-fold pyridoxal phosphate-dependent enzyme [Phycisphaerae bacterium]
MTIPVAERMKRLGTETAFAVSLEASQWAAKGNKVYPFHLGDLNIITPSDVIEAAVKAMKDGKTGYCPTAGIPALRDALAADLSKSHGLPLTADNVAIQPGGKPTIGKFIMVAMNPGDKVLYPNPGYPIYESQIEFHGGVGVAYGFKEAGDRFVLDMDAIRKGIQDGARILIYNNYQNPTGASSTRQEIEELARLAVKHNLTVLSDEAYFDMRFGGEPMSIASQPGMAERTVILYTFSKKFAMTGWRLGACVGPADFVAMIAKLNVNDESCSNHFIQYGALAGLKGDLTEAKAIVEVLRERRDLLVDALNRIDGVTCFRPEATFYLWPNVTGVMKRKGVADVEEFRKLCLHKTGVSFCTRRHFGRPLPGETQQYIRFAYSGINADQIKEAMARLSEFLA